MTHVPLVPRCPLCGHPLAYDGAPHASPSDALAGDRCPREQGSVPGDPVEYTVYRLYAQYPTSFGRSPWSRWYVFEQLFFVNGNEFEWLDGSLVDIFENQSEGPPPLLSSMEVAKQSNLLNKHRADFSWEQAAQQVEKDWSRYHRQPTTFYPLCEYADIFHIPAQDVSSCWLYAALDAIRMFWRISGDGQSVSEIYRLVRMYDDLCRRVQIPLPALDEAAMTCELVLKRK